MSDESQDKKHDKEYDIVVNGEPHSVPNQTVTYDQVVKIAFPEKAGNPEFTFVVTYRKAHEPKEGSLAEGGHVEVKNNGTIFNVTHTRRS